jgi:hypothetical protein
VFLLRLAPGFFLISYLALCCIRCNRKFPISGSKRRRKKKINRSTTMINFDDEANFPPNSIRFRNCFRSRVDSIQYPGKFVFISSLAFFDLLFYCFRNEITRNTMIGCCHWINMYANHDSTS